MLRRCVAGLLSFGISCAALGADEWPTRTVTLVVGYPAGGNTDMAGRVLANSMKQSLPVAVIVENKPGAGGTVGAAFVTRAAADGTVLLVASQSETTMLKANRANPPYDIEKDFIPVAKLMDQDYSLVVPKSVNVTTWSEFVSYAKTKGSLNYASSGIGTTSHVMSQHMMAAIGVQGVHVPYQGAAALRPDLVAGRVDFYIDVLPLATPMVTDGKLHAIAVTQTQRDQRLPGVPSLVELGVFPEQYAGWTGVFAPKGTPLETRRRILALINQMLEGPGGSEIKKNGYRPASAKQGLDDFAEFAANDQKRWIGVFQKAGIPPSP